MRSEYPTSQNITITNDYMNTSLQSDTNTIYYNIINAINGLDKNAKYSLFQMLRDDIGLR